jgi:hypothetical protein
MKKIFLILLFIIITFSKTLAYEPTDEDIKSINNAKEKLWEISHIK